MLLEALKIHLPSRHPGNSLHHHIWKVCPFLPERSFKKSRNIINKTNNQNKCNYTFYVKRCWACHRAVWICCSDLVCSRIIRQYFDYTKHMRLVIGYFCDNKIVFCHKNLSIQIPDNLWVRLPNDLTNKFDCISFFCLKTSKRKTNLRWCSVSITSS